MAVRNHPDLASEIELASAIDTSAMPRKHTDDQAAAWTQRLREDSHRAAAPSGNLIMPFTRSGT
jgi:hypothetical protein